ncbi:MAG: hypothetical protein GY757_23965 [bacterium]|nr:hypothetical protein [bacterium]
MKKLIFILVVVLVGIGFTFNALVADESVDPTGVVEQMQALHADYVKACNALVANVPLDYSPVCGVVKKEDLPVHKDGWKDIYVPELFPGKTVLSHKSYTIKVTGLFLVEHKADDGASFYVWHKFENEDLVIVSAVIKGETLPQTMSIIPGCGNWVRPDLMPDGTFNPSGLPHTPSVW